mmetsp:Transcript_35168/g.92090  ORF Transcript_35168/g.92090 Transcript_35168/m.92090 type:complete len:261 (+) Transcript_35168:140-922(+)
MDGCRAGQSAPPPAPVRLPLSPHGQSQPVKPNSSYLCSTRNPARCNCSPAVAPAATTRWQQTRRPPRVCPAQVTARPPRATAACCHLPLQDAEPIPVQLQPRGHTHRDHRRNAHNGMVQDALPSSAQRGLLVPARRVALNQVRGPAGLASTEHAVPHAPQGAEGVVAPLVPLVVPVVVVGHLRERKPPLHSVGHVESAADPGVLLQALEDAEDVREPECAVVQGNQDLGESMSNNRVAEVVQPVVLVRVPRQGMPSPMVE